MAVAALVKVHEWREAVKMPAAGATEIDLRRLAAPRGPVKQLHWQSSRMGRVLGQMQTCSNVLMARPNGILLQLLRMLVKH